MNMNVLELLWFYHYVTLLSKRCCRYETEMYNNFIDEVEVSGSWTVCSIIRRMGGVTIAKLERSSHVLRLYQPVNKQNKLCEA